jgi:CheY-like chemotaxis protein
MALSRPAPVHAADAIAAPAAPRPDVSLEMIVAELRELRRVQEQILAVLGSPSVPAFAPFPPVATAPAATAAEAVARRVLLVDDDAGAAAAAAEALGAARIAAEVAADGNAALAAIARDRPHAIVMELEIGGAMAGKDVVNMLRATMEWVDIPVVLYTRTPIASLEDARSVHGGDAFVPKAAGAETLVACLRSILAR